MPRSKKSKRRKSTLNVPKVEALKQINLNAAGLDIGDDEIWVAVPEGRDEVSVRVFQTFTADLYALADWLAACGVDTVAMESTGVYWIPIYEILEERGFEVSVDPNFESRVAKARDWCNLMSIKSKPKENADAPHD
jgi:hypothetical protein